MPVNSGAAGKTLQKSCQKQQKGWPKGQPFVLIWRVRKDCLQLAELEELLPVFVHFLLDLFDHPLVAGMYLPSTTSYSGHTQVSTAILVTSISFSLGYRQPRGQGAITFRNAAPGV